MKGFKVGLGNGMTFCASFFTYALGFWYGAKLIADQKDEGCTNNCLSGGTVIAVFFCVIIGASALGQLAPPLGALFSAKVREIHFKLSSFCHHHLSCGHVIPALSRSSSVLLFNVFDSVYQCHYIITPARDGPW